MGPCIFSVWDEPVDGPPFDLVRRPRPLIFGADSARARARAETVEVLALLPAGRPAPGRAPPRAIDYSCGLILFKAPRARTLEVKHYPIAKIRAVIPPFRDQDDDADK